MCVITAKRSMITLAKDMGEEKFQFAIYLNNQCTLSYYSMITSTQYEHNLKYS